MIEFSSEHSATWLELMRAYQKYREAIFYWVKETDTVKRQDLFLELGAPIDSSDRDLHKRLRVTAFLSSQEMWDEKTLLLACEELVVLALTEQEEVAARARMALTRIKSQTERLSIANRVCIIAAKEAEKEKPDYEVFHNGCILLRDLENKEYFTRFVEQYKQFIYLAYGLDENDLEDMKNRMVQGQ